MKKRIAGIKILLLKVELFLCKVEKIFERYAEKIF